MIVDVIRVVSRFCLCCLLLIAACRADVDELIIPGDSWHYLDDGSDQGTAWKEIAFDDQNWKQGLAELGYGDGDEKTVIEFGDNSSRRHITSYFRKSISLLANPNLTRSRLLAHLLVDDGAIVYVNGTEVIRVGMPQGEISFQRRASETVGGDDEATFRMFDLDPSLLRSGQNVVAVEVHQASPSSSDVSFDFALTLTTIAYKSQFIPTAENRIDGMVARVNSDGIADLLISQNSVDPIQIRPGAPFQPLSQILELPFSGIPLDATDLDQDGSRRDPSRR